MASPVRLGGEAAEVALAEAQAVLALVHDDERRGRLADLIAAVGDGGVDGTDADALQEVLELGLQTGRVRAIYGPAGEQAALKVYRQLPGGRELGKSTQEVTEALASLEGKQLETVRIQATGPAAFLVTLVVDGLEVSVRLDRQGARLNSIGV
jgi:hypothetical protein